MYGLYTADQVAGLKGVIMVQGSICVLSALIIFFFYAEANSGVVESEDDKFQSKDIFVVIKDPNDLDIRYFDFLRPRDLYQYVLF